MYNGNILYYGKTVFGAMCPIGTMTNNLGGKIVFLYFGDILHTKTFSRFQNGNLYTLRDSLQKNY